MLSSTPLGMFEPSITMGPGRAVGCPLAGTWIFFGPEIVTTSPTPGAGWTAVRQNCPAVTRAGMPCSARAWRTALGSATCPGYRVSVVVPPGPAATVNAARRTPDTWRGDDGPALWCSAGAAGLPVSPTTSAAHAPAATTDRPPRRSEEH